MVGCPKLELIVDSWLIGILLITHPTVFHEILLYPSIIHCEPLCHISSKPRHFFRHKHLGVDELCPSVDAFSPTKKPPSIVFLFDVSKQTIILITGIPLLTIGWLNHQLTSLNHSCSITWIPLMNAFTSRQIQSWLVVSTPLKNMISSIGLMKFPINMEKKSSHVPATTNQLISVNIFYRWFPHLFPSTNGHFLNRCSPSCKQLQGQRHRLATEEAVARAAPGTRAWGRP